MSTFVKHSGAIYTPAVEQLPLYTENEEGLPRYTEDDEDQEHPEREGGPDRIQLFLNGLLSSPDESQLDPHIVKDLLQDEHRRLSDIVSSRAQFGIYRGELATDELSFIALAITRLLFRSISAGKSETISWLISQNLVSPNIIDTDVGRAAIRRTPLQLAAELGNLPLVKMFIETYQCDDSKVAPDGELALRLASKNGHRHVVDYLPARRGGGWKRWRTAHEVSMAKARDALKSIFEITLFLRGCSHG
ncbi:predicted protein [Histoplasma mississippiense (nom. inval.)]|uniref:predicted protein n=1 Tax=Ajellomyces capsulatus (strain NAm1 / WU24) TaxID=2059318 RepID=UPI000157D195|nr:predicted protein [Histoplasma mississippiense (nom. inval.)]EDN10917.1 predicted protein [Histoplasma mississippiense (nom. inval.)]